MVFEMILMPSVGTYSVDADKNGEQSCNIVELGNMLVLQLNPLYYMQWLGLSRVRCPSCGKG